VTSALITGAGGFIGRRVVCAANGAGYGVTPIVRKSQLDDVRNVIKQDLRLPLSKLPSVDWIFHLAGTYAGADDHKLQRVDLQMVRNVIRCGLEAGIKNWVFASAAEVYGDVCGIAMEETPTQPVIPYGCIKRMVERLLLEKIKCNSNCRVVILRIGEVYGHDGRLITELRARLKRGFCPWPGRGDVPLSFLARFLSSSRSASRSAAPSISSRNVDSPLCRVRHAGLPSHWTRTDTDTAGSTTYYHTQGLSNTRLKHELGFQPRYPSYSEGLEEALRGVPHHP
jgi:nucleoside-diphosphate-sugar epimerase